MGKREITHNKMHGKITDKNKISIHTFCICVENESAIHISFVQAKACIALIRGKLGYFCL